MPAIINLAAEFGAGIISNNSLVTGSGAGVRFSSLSSAGVVVQIDRTPVLSTPTTPLIAVDIGSAASVAVVQLVGQSFVSCTTILFTTGAVAGTGALRVLYPDGSTLGWIPILPSGSVTAAARG